MAVLEPDNKWDWTLSSEIPLQSHLAHKVVCNEIDNCTNLDDLRSAAKSYHALYKKTQHLITKLAKQDFGFPTNMDGA